MFFKHVIWTNFYYLFYYFVCYIIAILQTKCALGVSRHARAEKIEEASGGLDILRISRRSTRLFALSVRYLYREKKTAH